MRTVADSGGDLYSEVRLLLVDRLAGSLVLAWAVFEHLAVTAAVGTPQRLQLRKNALAVPQVGITMPISPAF
jgi:hypothetical protein